ncbi:MAG: zinc metallohydrolase [Bacillales bacterium]|nr:zinc metallohydrolase [Bacillales bacterium]
MSNVIEVLPNIFQITLPVPFSIGVVHVYLVKGEDLTLIDCGVKDDKSLEILETSLNTLNLKISDISRVFITHHHPDHCGGLAYFNPDTEIVGHKFNEPWITQETSFLENARTNFIDEVTRIGVPIEYIGDDDYITDDLNFSSKSQLTRIVSDGDFVSDFKVHYTPGHASSHIVLLRETDGVLFGGDILLSNVAVTPFIELDKDGGRYKSSILYYESLNKLSELPIKTILPSHGDIITNHNQLINVRIKQFQKRVKRALDIIKTEGSLTPFELSLKLFNEATVKKQFSVTVSEALGHIDYLENQGLISMNLVNNKYYVVAN